MRNVKLKDILDIDFREKIILYPLIIMIILIGIFPNIFLDPMRLPIELIINNYEFANAK
jgi:NADH-quinone oxidoreductase subunit M